VDKRGFEPLFYIQGMLTNVLLNNKHSDHQGSTCPIG